MSNNLTPFFVSYDTLPMGVVSQDVIKEKYFKGNESTVEEVFRRVAHQMALVEKPEHQEKIQKLFFTNMLEGAIGAGRIMSSGGTMIKTTLINCFVQSVGDSIRGFDDDGLPGIYEALAQAAETMRMGGGVGYNFSAIRPRGAWINSTKSQASGPCSYMNVFDASCTTVESLGARRGAQMGMLNDNHPDIMEFIKAKHTKGRWNNFNVSVAVSDSFMQAVKEDAMWDLWHKAEPHREAHPDAKQREDGMWIYKTIRAREMWDAIMENTYSHAEPGIIFVDRVNSENPLYYVEKIDCTNPCVTKKTWTHTTEGPRQVHELIGKPFTALVNGVPYVTQSEGFFLTGFKDVYRLNTLEGYHLELTEDHPVLVRGHDKNMNTIYVDKEAKDLLPGDRIVLSDNGDSAYWPGNGDDSQGYLLGYLVGNGTLKEDKAVLPVWENGGEGHVSVKTAIEYLAKDLSTRSDFKGFQKPIVRNGVETGEQRLASTVLRDLAFSVGMEPGNKMITPEIEKASSEFYQGFLRGLFDADGTVDLNSRDIRLSQSNLETLEAVQRMLSRLGIKSVIYKNRHKEGVKMMPDGKGGMKEYHTKANHDLAIKGVHRTGFYHLVGFNHFEKKEDLKALVAAGIKDKREMEVTFTGLVHIGQEDVYDVTIVDIHHFEANGMVVHNCGEQPLPPYGCCDLGPIILPFLISNPFNHRGDAFFDFGKLEEMVKIQTRFLDNVLDSTYWPLEEQKKEAAAKRRIGIGYTGLGNAIAMMGLKYNSDEGRAFAAKIAQVMRDAAYEASSDLAAEKGSFPLFDADKYLASPFVSRLPEHIKEKIKSQGMRNSHLLSIAPTGTVSLAFGNNTSNGIEPPFSWTYMRNKRVANDEKISYNVEDFSYALFRSIFGPDAPLPEYMVTALEMSALDHLKMMEVTQPYIDSAISKTVNVPVDYPFDDFKDLYMQGWEAGLKGLATYRPNDTLGAVLEVSAPKKEEPKPVEKDEQDLSSIRIERRPDGSLPSMNKKVECSTMGQQFGFYLNVGFTQISNETKADFRAIEFFLKNIEGDFDTQWVEAAMRGLSLAARGGDLARALRDMKKVRWNQGPVRYGWVDHVDGYKVPRFHPSLVAVVAFVIEEIIEEFGTQMRHRDLVTKVQDAFVGIAKETLIKSLGGTPDSEKKEVVPSYELGRECPECHAPAMVRRDGCEKCTNCGLMGSCG